MFSFDKLIELTFFAWLKHINKDDLLGQTMRKNAVKYLDLVIRLELLSYLAF